MQTTNIAVKQYTRASIHSTAQHNASHPVQSANMIFEFYDFVFCTAHRISRRAKRRRTPTVCTLHQQKSMYVLPQPLLSCLDAALSPCLHYLPFARVTHDDLCAVYPQQTRKLGEEITESGVKLSNLLETEDQNKEEREKALRFLDSTRESYNNAGSEMKYVER